VELTSTTTGRKTNAVIKATRISWVTGLSDSFIVKTFSVRTCPKAKPNGPIKSTGLPSRFRRSGTQKSSKHKKALHQKRMKGFAKTTIGNDQ